MLTNDKILKGGEITAAGEYSNGSSFFVFLMPKAELEETCLLNVTLHADTKPNEFPFIPNMWNPVAVKKLNLSQNILDNYRVFWGTEYL